MGEVESSDRGEPWDLSDKANARSPRHASIHLAFKRRKEEVPQVRLSASEKLLREQVQQLTAKNANLSDEVNRLRQLFLQLQYSLYKKGFTEEMFLEAQMQPLPRIDRDRSV